MSEHKIISSLTKFDAFLCIAGHKAIDMQGMQDSMWLTDDSNLQSCVNALQDEKLITKNEEGMFVTAEGNAKAIALYDVLKFSLSLDIDYNFYLQDNVQKFLSETYGLSIFSPPQIRSLQTSIVHNILRRFCEDDLAIIFTYEPLAARVVSCHFTDLLCAYFGIKPKRSFFFKRKVNIGMILSERLVSRIQKDMEQLVVGSKLLFPGGKPSPESTKISKLQYLLKYDIVRNNADVFDTRLANNNKKAHEFLDEMVSSQRQLTLAIIARYHALSMLGRDEPMPYRTVEVEVRNNVAFKITPASQIEASMNNFIETYRHRIKKVTDASKAMELAAYVYNELIHIQPYEDGNSRMSMLAMLHVLRIYKTKIESIPSSYEFRFVALTKGAKKRNDDDLVELFREISLININKEELKEMQTYL